jgi:ATP-binding cassette subfamily C protein
MDRLKVASSLETAGLSVFIGGLTAGIDTDVGKLNDGLSGGQIQRLGLARALYTKPDIIIMDEATSALDAESEYAVRKSLDNMRGRITIVMIAHRLHTVQHSDHVFLMDEGRVVDQGKFQELVRRNSSISRLVELMKVGEA